MCVPKLTPLQRSEVHSTFLSSSWNIREVVGPPNRLLNESVAFPISKVADNIPYMFNLEVQKLEERRCKLFVSFLKLTAFLLAMLPVRDGSDAYA